MVAIFTHNYTDISKNNFFQNQQPEKQQISKNDYSNIIHVFYKKVLDFLLKYTRNQSEIRKI